VNYVVKFGNIRVEGAQVRVVHKTSKDQNDEPRAEVARFLPAGVASKASAPKARAAAAEPDEDEEAPF
jgi:ribosomal protein L12E/L44/L45/RPP1/RPP2